MPFVLGKNGDELIVKRIVIFPFKMDEGKVRLLVHNSEDC